MYGRSLWVDPGTGLKPTYVEQAKRESEPPSCFRRGGCATRGMVPFLIGADGVVWNDAKPRYGYSRSAHSNRCAARISIGWLRIMYTTPPFAKKRANGTPPNPGGEFLPYSPTTRLKGGSGCER